MIRHLPSERAERMLTVDEVALRVRNLIDYDEVLSHVSVEGELTDFKRHVSGHIYFSIKGNASLLACVMFRSDAAGQLLWPQVGDRVCVVGSVRLYEARGTVQLYARKMFPLGVGAAARAKEELRARLEKEGLFSPARKRPIPRYPRTVACVTSDTGAAVRDVIKQFKNRYPLASLVVVPCLVQGVHAAESAAEALRRAQTVQGAEVILLVRGGGAKEDLNPFDDEELVREVARSAVPVVTGIGHEIDDSLCDLAADCHEPTPTAAAAAVFPDRNGELELVAACAQRLFSRAAAALEIGQRNLDSLARDLSRNVTLSLENAAQHVDHLSEKMSAALSDRVTMAKALLDGLARALSGLSPYALAQKGYALVLHGKKPVTRIAGLEAKDRIVVQLPDGDARATVTSLAVRDAGA